MKEDKVKLRHAKPADINSIIEIPSKLDRPLPKNRNEIKKFQKLIKSYIQGNSTNSTNINRGIILATSNSKILGLVSYVLLERLNQLLSEFWIPELVVSEEYRNSGIGKLLIQRCESLAKRNKCYRIRLESRNDRISSHNFYKKIGFQQIAFTFEKKIENKK
ncbi:MAG TPA: GNAT family N-acetyltransferase [Nitrososphaeraceae archaeon]|jgi:ribosomal protein S18 acetylase RimI-like enzyme